MLYALINLHVFIIILYNTLYEEATEDITNSKIKILLIFLKDVVWGKLLKGKLT